MNQKSAKLSGTFHLIYCRVTEPDQYRICCHKVHLRWSLGIYGPPGARDTWLKGCHSSFWQAQLRPAQIEHASGADTRRWNESLSLNICKCCQQTVAVHSGQCTKMFSSRWREFGGAASYSNHAMYTSSCQRALGGGFGWFIDSTVPVLFIPSNQSASRPNIQKHETSSKTRHLQFTAFSQFKLISAESGHLKPFFWFTIVWGRV